MKHVYFLVMPAAHMLDLAGPLQIINSLPELGLAEVRIRCISPAASVESFQPVTLTNLQPLPATLPAGAVVFVIGSKLSPALMRSEAWRRAVRWLQAQSSGRQDALTLCGVCTGTFLLADAGLLDGRLCTTHHAHIPRLRSACPATTVLENRVFVQDGALLTSAGVASGIDLALHLVCEAFGEDAALQVARDNVVHFRRFGADPELSAATRYRAHGNQRIHAVQDAIATQLRAPITLESLADEAGLSARHLTRLFQAETGISIKQFQIALRLDRARKLMTGSRWSLETIAAECGFGSVQALRANWNRHEDQPPSSLRARRGLRPQD
ncbi:Transcriptional regulator GlxA family, contains an amidase domain and an AraC-type DNA-binding HTH domain [Roseateles sp. YR242]|uniref:GlxA family transcriptional regulator n=1 Tax=Roseateles sp. YR242 TaxID=1855305 RepID=UPI0008B540B3|nr:helix-turn-helix domain-containing protein [Roseateles sp. YR242]SEL91105.1 Transcriptional regulator GlxA family, contains an amidase domain and an AraC-type DNA-binding HTH domain [Roseateles sp. YR242]